MVPKQGTWIVDVQAAQQAKQLDEEYWAEYLEDIHPDDRTYMPFHRYLAMRLHNQFRPAFKLPGRHP